MRRQLWCVGVVMGSVLLHSATTPSRADVFLIPVCADRDLRAITFIEEHGMADDIASSEFGQAGLAMLEARLDCYAGRIEEGIARYDSILRIAPAKERRE